jgi:hypothetical protein
MNLSVIIPARNEEFLQRTVQDVLANIQGETEIIVVLDGAWPTEPLEQHDRVTVIFNPEPVGQRAAINQGVRVSTARYCMKLDAHCSVSPGFDVAMISAMEPGVTMVPVMYNLHAFDWVCANGHRRYQGPSGPCSECGAETTKDILWKAKRSPETTSMRFDQDLKFQYFAEYKPKQQGDLVETMSILGACFMAERSKFLELNLCDETYGSWGQQGTEVACKTWLSGGRVLVNRKAWFAHMFRTQGGDFGFPYSLSQGDVDKARKFSRAQFVEGGWTGKYPLSWLVDRFAPVPGWSRKAALYYTDSEIDERLAARCRASIVGVDEIVSVSLKPLAFGKNICLDKQRGIVTMFEQILAGLEAIESDIVFFCEHDMLYHPSHFEFIPAKQDVFYYNTNVYKVAQGRPLALHYDVRQTSGLCAFKPLLLEHYRKRLEMVKANGFSRAMGFEPGTHRRAERVDDYRAESWQSAGANVDIRHDKNLTATRWSKEQFRNQKFTAGWIETEEVPGWGHVREIVNY